LVLLLSVVIFEIVVIILLKTFYIENVNAVLKSALEINSKFYNHDLVEGNSSAKEFVKDFVHLPYHIQITDKKGKVIADSLNQAEYDI
jgi:hypothetical protein